MISGVLSEVVLRLLSCLVSPINIEPLVTVVNLDWFADDISESSIVHAKKVGDGLKIGLLTRADASSIPAYPIIQVKAMPNTGMNICMQFVHLALD